jgi:hypothetical protein
MREPGFSHKTFNINSNNANEKDYFNNDYINDGNYSDNILFNKKFSPKMYRKSVARSKNFSTYSVCINDHTNRNVFFHTNLPSKDEIQESLRFVDRKNKISCDLRIVEIGVLMKVIYFLLLLIFFCTYAFLAGLYGNTWC